MWRPPLRLLRLANPFVRAVLGSPAHRLLSGSLLVLEYRGPRSGRTFRIPLMYAREGEQVIALASNPRGKQWWRAFRHGAPASLTVARRTIEADGHLLAGPDARRAALRYAERFPRARALVDAPVAEAALVVFTPREPVRPR
jgi:F420H(2)-dependent quinone reductase